jgi:hypothetical protein
MQGILINCGGHRFELLRLCRSAKGANDYIVCCLAAAGYSQQNTIVAAAAPNNCAMMKPGASAGRMPAKVFVAARAKVTAGLAKEVEDVNQ